MRAQSLSYPIFDGKDETAQNISLKSELRTAAVTGSVFLTLTDTLQWREEPVMAILVRSTLLNIYLINTTVSPNASSRI